MLKLIVGLLTLTSANVRAIDFNQFAAALIKVESSGNPLAFNKKENAKGALQVRPAYFKDAQIFDSELRKYSHDHCFDKRVAVRVLWAYCSKYEPQALKRGDWETLARLHNGGCGWADKQGKAKTNLNNYWQKVSANLPK